MEREHSVKGYLQRQSTEKLIRILMMYQSVDQQPEEKQVVAWIMNILEERKIQEHRMP